MKISIVTPSFNQGQYLEKTITSVLEQNYENTEYHILDGGSTDNSKNVLKKFDDEITSWVSEKDKGQSHAINKGIKLSNGEIFGYINSDDFYEDGVFDIVVKFFNKNPNIDIIYGNFNYVDKNSNILSKQKGIPFDSGIFRYDQNLICQPASFWRENVFNKVGLFDEDLKFFMDYEFFLRCIKNGLNIKYVNFTIANLRLHDECKTVYGQGDFVKTYKAIRQSILDPYQINLSPGKGKDYKLFFLRILYRIKFYFIYIKTHKFYIKESYKSVVSKI
jgi:glycosyltransferase involved in cell wall biosynthesis